MRLGKTDGVLLADELCYGADRDSWGRVRVCRAPGLMSGAPGPGGNRGRVAKSPSGGASSRPSPGAPSTVGSG